jgi:Uncharacterised protein conserved in bacteria (DUF2336)
VAPNPRGPNRSVRQLAFDDAIGVARPVLTLSPLLLDDHLLALATVKSTEHLMAICERTLLTERITDVILSRANGEIRVALVSNKGAVFSRDGRSRLAEAALDDPALFDLVSTRTDLAPTLEALDIDFVETPDEALPAVPGTVLAAHEDEMRDLLDRNLIDQALGLIARILAAPVAPVARAFALDVNGGFLAYAKAANLSWGLTQRFLIKRYEAGRITPRLSNAERDYAALRITDARRVVSLLVQHGVRTH